MTTALVKTALYLDVNDLTIDTENALSLQVTLRLRVPPTVISGYGPEGVAVSVGEWYEYYTGDTRLIHLNELPASSLASIDHNRNAVFDVKVKIDSVVGSQVHFAIVGENASQVALIYGYGQRVDLLEQTT